MRFYSDGDGSSFPAVGDIYQEEKVKMVGNRQRKLRQRVKGLRGKGKAKEVLRHNHDGEIVKVTKKAKGKPTNSIIDILQHYFGIALRSDAKTVPKLKCVLLASFFVLHRLKMASITHIVRTNLYKPGRRREDEVIKHVKTEYEKLTDEKEPKAERKRDI